MKLLNIFYIFSCAVAKSTIDEFYELLEHQRGCMMDSCTRFFVDIIDDADSVCAIHTFGSSSNSICGEVAKSALSAGGKHFLALNCQYLMLNRCQINDLFASGLKVMASNFANVRVRQNIFSELRSIRTKTTSLTDRLNISLPDFCVNFAVLRSTVNLPKDFNSIAQLLAINPLDERKLVQFVIKGSIISSISTSGENFMFTSNNIALEDCKGYDCIVKTVFTDNPASKYRVKEKLIECDILSNALSSELQSELRHEAISIRIKKCLETLGSSCVPPGSAFFLQSHHLVKRTSVVGDSQRSNFAELSELIFLSTDFIDNKLKELNSRDPLDAFQKVTLKNSRHFDRHQIADINRPYSDYIHLADFKFESRHSSIGNLITNVEHSGVFDLSSNVAHCTKNYVCKPIYQIFGIESSRNGSCRVDYLKQALFSSSLTGVKTAGNTNLEHFESFAVCEAICDPQQYFKHPSWNENPSNFAPVASCLSLCELEFNSHCLQLQFLSANNLINNLIDGLGSDFATREDNQDASNGFLTSQQIDFYFNPLRRLNPYSLERQYLVIQNSISQVLTTAIINILMDFGVSLERPLSSLNSHLRVAGLLLAAGRSLVSHYSIPVIKPTFQRTELPSAFLNDLEVTLNCEPLVNVMLLLNHKDLSHALASNNSEDPQDIARSLIRIIRATVVLPYAFESPSVEIEWATSIANEILFLRQLRSSPSSTFTHASPPFVKAKDVLSACRSVASIMEVNTEGSQKKNTLEDVVPVEQKFQFQRVRDYIQIHVFQLAFWKTNFDYQRAEFPNNFSPSDGLSASKFFNQITFKYDYKISLMKVGGIEAASKSLSQTRQCSYNQAEKIRYPRGTPYFWFYMDKDALVATVRTEFAAMTSTIPPTRDDLGGGMLSMMMSIFLLKEGLSPHLPYLDQRPILKVRKEWLMKEESDAEIGNLDSDQKRRNRESTEVQYGGLIKRIIRTQMEQIMRKNGVAISPPSNSSYLKLYGYARNWGLLWVYGNYSQFEKTRDFLLMESMRRHQEASSILIPDKTDEFEY